MRASEGAPAADPGEAPVPNTVRSTPPRSDPSPADDKQKAKKEKKKRTKVKVKVKEKDD
jgi:hypothetical protein